MSHDHEGQRVSRLAVFAGVSSIGLGSLLAACGQDDTPVTTSTGATVSPQATTTTTNAGLTSLFTGLDSCKLTEATTQGPYYFDADKIRSDVREDRPGVQLRLAIKVQDSGECKPLSNAVVEIWHCDAAGLYSGAESLSSGGGRGGPPRGAAPGGGADLTPADDKRYLRGAQVTNADGIVQFTTVWPGWYRGRTVHVHAMVHVRNDRVLTTQMMFDEKLNDAVFAQAPYAAHTGRDTTNSDDSIYDDSMLMKVSQDGAGYLGVIVLAADPG
jgi:protocatechuate 3,4-dioxygenase beta subunit